MRLPAYSRILGLAHDNLSFTRRIRYDGYPIIKTPKLAELSEPLQEMLHQKTALDRKLYNLALHRWKAMVDAEGASFQEELSVFRRVQESLRNICLDEREHPACVWYKLNDLQFARMIDKQNFAQEVPFEF